MNIAIDPPEPPEPRVTTGSPGPADEECSLYASHTIWEDESAFRAWTESEAFKKAHAQARAPSGTYLGHPVFEGFEAII